jgi:3-dehydroquinate synthase
MENQSPSAPIVIESYKGPYTAHFNDEALDNLNAAIPAKAHFIMDSRVADLYRDCLQGVLASPSVLLVEALETNKSLDRMPDYVRHLVSKGVRRDHTLIAIGGGILQDITCFLAATLLRGIDWKFYPTTLLAQADSCIGSKSSINAGDAKNIMGTFTPPKEIHISTRLLQTLDEADVRSGVGEMLKVHAIEGPAAFAGISDDYDRLFTEQAVMMAYIRRSLEIKKAYIETDEFDQGPRNIFNYGHSFGHAIEAATNFGIPHGIGVTIGMDMANYVAAESGVGSIETFISRHDCLKRNYRTFEDYPVPVEPFLQALGKDKKNVGSDLVLILPDAEGKIRKTRRANDNAFRQLCATFLGQVRLA